MQSLLTEDEEFDLVLLARAGDVHAFDRLAKEYRTAAILVAAGILGCSNQAEDAAQDALLSAYKCLPQLKQPEKFSGWLGSIVRNRALRLARKEEISAEPLEAHLDSLILRAAPSISADNPDFDPEEAIANLPTGIREIAALYYLQEWPLRRISEMLSLPITTLKWRLNVARKQLRKNQKGTNYEPQRD